MQVLAGLTRVPVNGRPLPGHLDLGSNCLLLAAVRQTRHVDIGHALAEKLLPQWLSPLC